MKSNINNNRDYSKCQKYISLKRNIINDINLEKGCITTKRKVILEPIWEKLNQKMSTN